MAQVSGSRLEAVRRLLPEYLRGLVTVADITGWRIQSELLPLQWRQVDFAVETLRLEPGTTTNWEGRVFDEAMLREGAEKLARAEGVPRVTLRGAQLWAQ